MTVQSFKHLPIDNPVSIHHGKICSLATRLYRAKNNLSFKIIVELFERRNVIYNALSDFSVTLFRIGFPPPPVTRPKRYELAIKILNFLTLSFNYIAKVLQNFKATTSTSPKLLNLKKDHSSNKSIFRVKSLQN